MHFPQNLSRIELAQPSEESRTRHSVRETLADRKSSVEMTDVSMRRNPSLPNWQVNQESLTHTSGLIELDPALKACSGLELIPRAACNTNPHAPSSWSVVLIAVLLCGNRL